MLTTRRVARKYFFIYDIVENIDSVNKTTKTEKLLTYMRRRDVLAFLEAVITHRVPKDDLNLEILADLVKQVNERFPGTGKRAVFELNRKIKVGKYSF